MTIYLLLYALIYTPLLYNSLKYTFYKEKINQSIAYYTISIILLSYALPLYFFKFQNYTLSSLIILLILGYLTVLVYTLFRKNKKTLVISALALLFTYYTFCYILATNLTNL